VISDLQPSEKVTFAVGTIVLRCQEVERLFKFVIPFISGGSPTWTQITAHLDELARKTLGDVAGRFVGCTSGDTDALQAYVRNFVDRRNVVVHKFNEEYGQRWAAGQHEEVLAELRLLHQDATTMLRLLKQITADIAEKTRDALFVGSDELDGFSAMCGSLRASAERIL